MSKDFDYAHSNKNVIWMSQNTNHLHTHSAVQEAIKNLQMKENILNIL